MKRIQHQKEIQSKPITFTRADPQALAAFDPRSKLCTMNCGPHAEDPRTEAERRYLCPECVEEWNR